MNLERKVAIITERHQASFLLQQNVWLREERLSLSVISMDQEEMWLWWRFKDYGLEAKFQRCDVTSGMDSCLVIDPAGQRDLFAVSMVAVYFKKER
jgi:hypothetical protein